jgi:capsular exopolysaccharide synthesis family protein
MDPLKMPSPQETKLHFLDYWRIIRIRKTVILAVFLLVVITATLVTFILPEYYSSTASIKVERATSDIPDLNSPRLVNTYDPYFIQDQFQTIQSSVVLGRVVDKLNLSVEWGNKYNGGQRLRSSEAINMLKAKLDLRPVRNTSFLEIRVLSENKDEAAKLANAVAEAYKDYRREEAATLSTSGLNMLKEKLDEQEKKVAEAQKLVDRLRVELKVPESIASGDMPQPLLSGITLQRVEESRIEAQAELVRQEKTLEQLKALKPEELMQTLPRVAQDAQLGSQLDQLTLAEQRLVAVEKEYGPEHSEVLKAKGLIADLKQKINDQVKGIMTSLETKVKSTRAYRDSLIAEVENATTLNIEKANQLQPYFNAKHAYDEQLRFRQTLDYKMKQEQIDQNMPKSMMVSIMEAAVPGLRPVKPNKLLNISLGIIIGLVVGVGLAFFIEYLDTSVKTIDDVERSLQSPVLGVIPQNVGLVIDEGADSPHTEAYRVLRTNLLFSRKDDKLNTVAVVSAGAGEGKSTTVFNLAAVFAQSGQRVIVVDSDLRRPTLHKMMKVTNSLGLTNYLLKQNSLEEVIQTSSIPTLDFMASGKLPSSSMGILNSAQMKSLIQELKQRYDFVFFDSPPIMGVSDASILASEVDMTLQVIQYRRYPQPMNIRAKQMIEKVGGNLVGIVLNNINMSQDESYYYYSGYYHDYYSRNEDQEPVAPGAGAEGKGPKPAPEV